MHLYITLYIQRLSNEVYESYFIKKTNLGVSLCNLIVGYKRNGTCILMPLINL